MIKFRRASLFHDISTARSIAVNMSCEVSRWRMRVARVSRTEQLANFSIVHSGSPKVWGGDFVLFIVSILLKVVVSKWNDTQDTLRKDIVRQGEYRYFLRMLLISCTKTSMYKL